MHAPRKTPAYNKEPSELKICSWPVTANQPRGTCLPCPCIIPDHIWCGMAWVIGVGARSGRMGNISPWTLVTSRRVAASARSTPATTCGCVCHSANPRGAKRRRGFRFDRTPNKSHNHFSALQRNMCDGHWTVDTHCHKVSQFTHTHTHTHTYNSLILHTDKNSQNLLTFPVRRRG
jgi:hypothetical protein